MFGTSRIHHEVIDSTNTYAKSLIPNNPDEGTAVTADYQSAGRGRLERRWRAEPGENLLVSFILYPPRPRDEWGGLTLLAGCAVSEMLERLTGLHTHLKWPNDVMIGDRKVCGILLEAGVQDEAPWCIIGIGINVNQTRFEGDFRQRPTSVMLECDTNYSTDSVFDELCSSLDAMYGQWKTQGNLPVVQQWKARSKMIGRVISLSGPEGTRTVTAVDIDAKGALIVRNAHGALEAVYSGDVSVTLD